MSGVQKKLHCTKDTNSYNIEYSISSLVKLALVAATGSGLHGGWQEGQSALPMRVARRAALQQLVDVIQRAAQVLFAQLVLPSFGLCEHHQSRPRAVQAAVAAVAAVAPGDALSGPAAAAQRGSGARRALVVSLCLCQLQCIALRQQSCS